MRPFVSRIKVSVEKARRILKRKIEYFKRESQDNTNTSENEHPEPQFFDMDVINEVQEIKPIIGEY